MFKTNSSLAKVVSTKRRITEEEEVAIFVKFRSSIQLKGHYSKKLKRTIPDCFRGKEATNLLVTLLPVVLQNRNEAESLGKKYITRGWIVHVKNKHSFKDGRYFYVFTEEGKQVQLPKTGFDSLRTASFMIFADTAKAPAGGSKINLHLPTSSEDGSESDDESSGSNIDSSASDITPCSTPKPGDRKPSAFAKLADMLNFTKSSHSDSNSLSQTESQMSSSYHESQYHTIPQGRPRKNSASSSGGSNYLSNLFGMLKSGSRGSQGDVSDPIIIEEEKVKCDPNSLEALASKIDPTTVSTVQAMLLAPQVRKAFRKFCEQDHSEETIEFYDEVSDYKQIIDDKQRLEKARSIFEKYVSSAAEKSLNIASAVRKEVEKEVEKAEFMLFDRCMLLVEKDMQDPLERFKTYLETVYKPEPVQQTEPQPAPLPIITLEQVNKSTNVFDLTAMVLGGNLGNLSGHRRSFSDTNITTVLLSPEAIAAGATNNSAPAEASAEPPKVTEISVAEPQSVQQ